MKEIVVCMALALLLFGCGSSQSADPNLDAWEKEVRILSPSQVGERQYEELGGLLEAKAASREGFGGEERAIDAAERDLRLRAAKLDADAVAFVECGRHVRPVEDTHLPSMAPEVVCHGVAIRWMD